MVVKYLLDAGTATYPLKKAIFKKDGNEVDFYSFEVFPGLEKSVLDMPPDLLDKTAQQAKSQAIANANDPLKKYEQQHWNKNLFQIITIAIVVGLFFGILAFAFVWIVFFLIRWPVLGLIRWLVLGFVDNNK